MLQRSDGLKEEQDLQIKINMLEATLADIEQRFEAGCHEVERLTRDCEDYRNRWINEAREKKLMSRHLPADFALDAFSQARPWNSSPQCHTNSSPQRHSGKYSSQTSRLSRMD
jgi:hypothetical protein